MAEESRVLSDAERQRFIRWLREDAASNDQMAKLLDSESNPLMQALAKKKRMLVVAESIVAKELESAETFTI